MLMVALGPSLCNLQARTVAGFSPLAAPSTCVGKSRLLSAMQLQAKEAVQVPSGREGADELQDKAVGRAQFSGLAPF